MSVLWAERLTRRHMSPVVNAVAPRRVGNARDQRGWRTKSAIVTANPQITYYPADLMF